MAILKNTAFRGIDVQNAYFRVARAEVSKTDINFTVEACASATSPALFHKYYTCLYDIEGPNPIQQAYEHLKTLDEYHGHTDG